MTVHVLVCQIDAASAVALLAAARASLRPGGRCLDPGASIPGTERIAGGAAGATDGTNCDVSGPTLDKRGLLRDPGQLQPVGSESLRRRSHGAVRRALWPSRGKGQTGATDHLRGGRGLQRYFQYYRSVSPERTDLRTASKPGAGRAVFTASAERPTDLETGLRPLQCRVFHSGGGAGSDRQAEGSILAHGAGQRSAGILPAELSQHGCERGHPLRAVPGHLRQLATDVSPLDRGVCGGERS